MTLNAVKKYRNTTFLQYIKNDANRLIDLGLIKDSSESNNQNLNVSNDEAWLKYIHQKKQYLNILVGRGLYSLQLRQWFRYFPKSSFLFLNYDDLNKKDGAILLFNKVIEFLGLKEFQLYSKIAKRYNKGDYSNYTLDSATKKMVHDMYEPYNRELSSLLGPEWKGVWEYNDDI